jgi:hypothetical protein
VGEEEISTLIKKPRCTLRKVTPGAKTAWRDNSRVSLAEFFDAYQEANKANISASIEATTHTMRMISELARAEETMLRDAVKYLDERSSQLQQQVAMLLLGREEGQTAEDPMDIDVPEVPSPPDYLQIIQEAISDSRLQIAAVQSPVEGRARSNSAFPNDMFPLPVMPPPPPP